MAFTDGSIVAIALPIIQREFSTSLTATQWVTNAFMLFLGSLILVGGATGDWLGRRRIFVVGEMMFAVGSAGCALALDIGSLIAARVLKVVGAALMTPQSLAIISASFPPERRGAAVGVWARTVALATSLGPALGDLGLRFT